MIVHKQSRQTECPGVIAWPLEGSGRICFAPQLLQLTSKYHSPDWNEAWGNTATLLCYGARKVNAPNIYARYRI